MGKKKRFFFSENSLKNREGVKPQMVTLSNRALELSLIDFGIPKDGGFRTFEQQRTLFNDKKSLCDGRFKISPHQSGWALDFFAYVEGKASWYPPHLCAIAAAFLQAGTELGLPLDWGGFWSNKKKNAIDDVKYGWDCGHIQIVRNTYAELDTAPRFRRVNPQA